MAGGVREAWGGSGGVREEEEDERSCCCCCWESVGSLDLLSSTPTATTSPPPPPPFCLLTFQRMQPSSCRPPRPFPFHSPAGYGALPIPSTPPPPPPPPAPPPPAPPLPPQLLPSERYISIMTTTSMATSQRREEACGSRCARGGGCKVNKTYGCFALKERCDERSAGGRGWKKQNKTKNGTWNLKQILQMLPNERSLLQQHWSGVINQTATAVFAFPLPPSSVSARWQLFPSSHTAYSFAVLSIPRLLTMKRHFHCNTPERGSDAEQCLKTPKREKVSFKINNHGPRFPTEVSRARNDLW